MEDIYREHVLDHYERPRFHGALICPDITHREHNPLCGDQIQVELKLSDDRTRIAEVAFHGDGCVISQAAASMLMEAVAGRPVEDVQALDQEAMLALMGVRLTGARQKCALLGLKALKIAVYTLLANEPAVAT
jgi:nitrogen fixation NifU-like protein